MAFANSSPGFERSREPWGNKFKIATNPVRVRQLANPYRVQCLSCDLTQGCSCAPTLHAGGAGKNRKVDVVITLPAGNYKLRYKSDDSHAFDHSNSMPPDINFGGIALYKK